MTSIKAFEAAVMSRRAVGMESQFSTTGLDDFLLGFGGEIRPRDDHVGAIGDAIALQTTPLDVCEGGLLEEVFLNPGELVVRCANNRNMGQRLAFLFAMLTVCCDTPDLHAARCDGA